MMMNEMSLLGLESMLMDREYNRKSGDDKDGISSAMLPIFFRN